MPSAAPTPAAPPPVVASGAPRVIEVAAGSTLLPQGAVAAASSPATSSPAPAPAPAQSQSSDGVVAPATGTAGPATASAGASLLTRLLGVVPLIAGGVQAMVGFMITRGTISIVAAPLIGGWPRFIVGGLVAATSMPTILGAVAKLTGRPAPGRSSRALSH